MADKVSMSDFEQRLSDGHYNSIAGARRGVGKMSGWSEKERTAANAKVDAFFEKNPGGGKKAPKKAAVKPAKVKVAAKRGAARSPKADSAPEETPAQEVAAPVKRGRRSKASQLELPLEAEVSKVQASIQRSAALRCVLDNAKTTKDLGGPDAEIRKIAEVATHELVAEIEKLTGVAIKVARTASAPTSTPGTVPGNGRSTQPATTADAALVAAASAANRAAAGPMPPVIPPLMGR
jgi:hypothetical protein